MDKIYVLKLQQNKIFIYFGEMKPNKQIMKEAEIYYDYLKKYKPLSVTEVLLLTNYLDIDKTVKQYICIYGPDNVRGGSYIDEQLPDYLKKTLKKEIQFANREYFEWETQFKEILEKYENRKYENIEEIEREIDSIQQENKKYILEKERLEKYTIFSSNNERKTIKDFIPEEMNWLYSVCSLNFDNHSTSYIQKYRNLLVYLRELYKKFEENDLFSKFNIEKDVYLKYPEFLFDGFIYNSPIKDTKSLLNICKTYEHMGNILYNIIMEQEFDVLSYGVGYEWKYPRILYILGKKRENFGKIFLFDEPFI
jgi:hypothetical protein